MFLIYLALFQSPKSIQTYAIMIINFAITDLLECLLDLFLQTRLIVTPIRPIMVYVCNGICKFTGETSCKVGLGIFLHLLPHAVWSLLLSFSYRYYILFHPGLTKQKITFLIILIYIPSLFIALTYWTNLEEQDRIIRLADKVFPQYNLTHVSGIVVGIVNFTTFSTMYTIFMICIPICPVYFIIFYIRRKIIAHLMIHEGTISSETRAVHSQMLKCLTFQAFIPTFMLIAVVLFLLEMAGVIGNSINENLFFSIFLLMPVCSPISYITYVRPYRNFCLRFRQIGTGERTMSSKFDSAPSTVMQRKI